MAKSILKKKKIAIVVSRFNDFITQRLLDGCLDEFSKNRISKTELIVVWVPGAWEIPVVALKLASRSDVIAVVCLGAVIRGETAHYDVVAQGACQGVQQVALSTGKPVVLGVLTTDTIKQAQDRSSIKGNNKGREAALTAVEMIKVLQGC